MSRYAACTPGVIDRCVSAVASEVVDLDQVIPSLTKHEVALIARDALEALEREDAVTGALLAGTVQAGDWVRSLLVEGRFFLSHQLREAGRPDEARIAYDRAQEALEAIAASSDRSPVLYYQDIFLEAAQSLARRGDRKGLVRQVQSLAEELHRPNEGGVRGALLMLGEFQLRLGDHRDGLALTAAVVRRAPADVWTYNAIALAFPHLGLPALARLAAERGLALLRTKGDPERLSEQLAELRREAGSKPDRSDVPTDALEDLREALHTDFEGGSTEAWAALAQRMVPALDTAIVKALPPAPTDEELGSIAARLRAAVKRARRRAAATPVAAPRVPTVAQPAPAAPNAAPSAPKVGRNEPCPCGSGKKHKKCCLR